MSKLAKYVFPITLMFFLFSMSACSNEPEIDIKTGKWEWSMSMEMAGMKMPAVKYTSMVSKEDLVPQQANPDQRCKMLENKVVDNSVIWKMECQSEAGTSTSKGTVTYTKTTAEGEIDMITQGMSMKSRISGRYIGDK